MIELCKMIVCLPFDLVAILLFGEPPPPHPHREKIVYVIPSVSRYESARSAYCKMHKISIYEFECRVDSNEKYKPDFVRENMATRGVVILPNR